MFSANTHRKAHLIEACCGEIAAIMKGLGPDVQSAILADLMATYLAGLAPPIRDEMLEMLVQLTRDLVPINEALIFGPGGHPFKEPI